MSRITTRFPLGEGLNTSACPPRASILDPDPVDGKVADPIALLYKIGAMLQA